MKIAIGIDIGATNTKIILATEEGRVLQDLQIRTLSAARSGSDRVEELLIKNLRDFLNDEKTKVAISGADIVGIGIGVAGLIDRKNGKIIKSPNIASARRAADQRDI